MIPAVPRIGCVPYLNARPLLEGLNCPVTELVPSRLFEAYQQGMFDAALLSSIDVISMPTATVVDGVAIASRGDVYSVILAYSGKLKECETILLDPASHTSNALLQIILGEFYGLKPKYVQLSDYNTNLSTFHGPRLLIGDSAIALRKSLEKQTSYPAVKCLDLGAEWYRYTGLPFVFALWALRNDFMEKKLLSDALRQAKSQGLNNLKELASRTADPAFARRYFSEWIRYELGEEEKRGMLLFATLLNKYSMYSDKNLPISYL